VTPKLTGHEAKGLDADVCSCREPRLGKEPGAASRAEGPDAAAAFGGANEPTGIAPERLRGNRKPALDDRSARGYDTIAATAVEGVQIRLPRRRDSHEQAIAERTYSIDGDSGRECAGRQARERTAAAAAVHSEHPGCRSRLEHEDVVTAEGAAATRHGVTGPEREIRLAGRARVPSWASCERNRSGAAPQQEQSAARGKNESSVTPWPDHVDDPGNLHQGPPCADWRGGRGNARRDEQRQSAGGNGPPPHAASPRRPRRPRVGPRCRRGVSAPIPPCPARRR
jgi:hypothetical protein